MPLPWQILKPSREYLTRLCSQDPTQDLNPTQHLTSSNLGLLLNRDLSRCRIRILTLTLTRNQTLNLTLILHLGLTR